MGDEEIAEEDGGLVAVEMVDGGALAADFGAVEDIIMDEGGHMDHFDDGGEDDMIVGEGVMGVAGGQAGEEHEGGAEHFAAELGDVANEVVDVGEVGGQLAGEKAVDGLELGSDELGEVFGGIGGSRGSGLVSQCRGIGHIAPL